MPTLNWIGKDKVVNYHLKVPYHVLERKYSFDEKGQHEEDNGSENMIIHGDNLLALKSLLPKYEGKIKCIYIDPPYNTGNEGWIYNDNVNDPHIRKWLGEVVGKEGEDLSRHDKWLCMMYPRLRLLQRLLSEDGFIFVSIDAFEFTNLKFIMDEIFGESNFRNCISVRRGIKNVQAQFERLQSLALGHEYIYLYSKKPDSKLPKLSVRLKNEKPGKWDTFWRGTDRPTMRYEIFGQNPKSGQWRWERKRAYTAKNNYENFLASGVSSIDDYYIDYLTANNEKLDFVRLNTDGTVQYYVPPQTGKLLSDNWMDILLSGSFAHFDTEKNVKLIERMVRWITKGQDIILDSFAGSGTTAHAVLNQNMEDGAHRHFILIEMMDYANSITAGRVKKVIHGDGEGKKAVSGTGGNFSYYELGEPLMKDGFLNEAVSEKAIRQYVYFMDTRENAVEEKADEPYYLGTHQDTAYYFFYKKEEPTVLDYDFLGTVKTKAEAYVMYADSCLLSSQELLQYHITFKKIPRDIARL